MCAYHYWLDFRRHTALCIYSWDTTGQLHGGSEANQLKEEESRGKALGSIRKQDSGVCLLFCSKYWRSHCFAVEIPNAPWQATGERGAAFLLLWGLNLNLRRWYNNKALSRMKHILEEKSVEINLILILLLFDKQQCPVKWGQRRGGVCLVEYNNNTIIIREIQTLTSSAVQCLLTVFHHCYISPHLLIKSDGFILLTNVACTCTSMWTFFPHLLLPHFPNQSYFLIRWNRHTAEKYFPSAQEHRSTEQMNPDLWPPPQNMDADLLRKRKSIGISPTFYPHQRKDICFMSVMVRWQG